MLTWTYRPVLARPRSVSLTRPAPTGTDSEYLETWLGEGGDAMAIISRKPSGFELHVWWTKRMGQLTPDKRPVFPTLEEAQAAANDLVFARVDAWTRLTMDD